MKGQLKTMHEKVAKREKQVDLTNECRGRNLFRWRRNEKKDCDRSPLRIDWIYKSFRSCLASSQQFRYFFELKFVFRRADGYGEETTVEKLA